MADACARPGCTGEIDTDGYCTECGLAPERGGTAAPGGPCGRADCPGTVDPDGYCDECGLAATPSIAARLPAQRSAPAASAAVPGGRCGRADCPGTVDPDGYCDECGLAATPSTAARLPAQRSAPAAPAGRTLPGRTSSSATHTPRGSTPG
ncbi:hypothetical protein ACWEO1_40110, partial [Kitasatospora cineracea]